MVLNLIIIPIGILFIVLIFKSYRSVCNLRIMSDPRPPSGIELSQLERGIGDSEQPSDILRDGHGNNDTTADHHDLTHSASPSQLGAPSISRTRSRQTSLKQITSRVTRIITSLSNADVVDAGPPPDGGFKAWLQAIMGHLVILNTWGMISTFSVFQAYYTTELRLEPSAVSWIGSIQMLGHFGLGLLSGRAFDAGLFYWVVPAGVICTSLAMFMTSLCTQYYQLVLAQGVLFAIGSGLQFTPCTALVYQYFDRNKAVALAIMFSGSATGGLLYPSIARQLIPKLGFAWTTRICGFMILTIGCCYTALLKPRLAPRKRGPLFELSAFKELTYTLYVIGVFIITFAQYFGFFYIGSYALVVVKVSYASSVNLLMIMNAVGVPGRLIGGWIADRYLGAYNILIPFVFASGVVMYSWASVKSEVGLYIWVCFYGFVSAGFQGLFPSALSTLTTDLSRMGVRNGMAFAMVGLAALPGPPISGALVQTYGYFAAQMWAGSMILLGGMVLVVGRLVKTERKLMVKV